MKKLSYIILAIFLISSCTEKLNKFPLDKLSEADFFSTEKGLMAFSNAFYSDLPGAHAMAFDDADNYFTATQTSEVRGLRTVPASGGGWSWSALRNINTLLDNLHQCPDAGVRTYYEAVARFFRAYFYFEKVKRFGDVPWYDTQLASDSPDLYKPRDSRELVMQNIIKDIDFAIVNLSDQKSVYTITRWTAMALKSRICLFEGTFRKYHNISIEGGESALWYLDQCAKVSKEFIQTSGYKIYSTGKPQEDYLNLFAAGKYAGHESLSEVIMARNYNAEYGQKHSINARTLTASNGRYGMSRKTMAAYLMADGSRFTDREGWETFSFEQEMKDRDPRLSQSIRTPGYTRIGSTVKEVPMMNTCITGYQPIKYISDPGENGIKDTYGESDCDVILFRAAEVFLNYAEAVAELGTITDADLEMSVNKLRDRVRMPKLTVSVAEDSFLTDKEWGGYQNVTGANKALILEIRRERSVELNQEGFRYYDLMRWREGKILEIPMYGMYFPGPGEYDLDGDGYKDIYLYESGKKGSTTAIYQFELEKDIVLSEKTKGMIHPYRESPGNWTEEKDYLYPIPSGEFKLNSNLEQNPGWPLI